MSNPAVHVYCATSLDGYIARRNGDIDWLPASDSASSEDFGYADFIASIDTLVMGRKSFEKVLSFGNWPYEELRVIVLSSTNSSVPNGLENKVEFADQSPTELIARLANEGSDNIYLDGGETIQRFLKTGLVDSITITRIPVLIGSGISLFGDSDADIQLTLTKSRAFSNGLVQDSYLVVKDA